MQQHALIGKASEDCAGQRSPRQRARTVGNGHTVVIRCLARGLVVAVVVLANFERHADVEAALEQVGRDVVVASGQHAGRGAASISEVMLVLHAQTEVLPDRIALTAVLEVGCMKVPEEGHAQPAHGLGDGRIEVEVLARR